MERLVTPNHMRLRYNVEFNGLIASAGAIVKVLKKLGTPEYPKYDVEAFSNTRLAATGIVPDYAVEPIELLTPSCYLHLNLKKAG